MTLANQPSGVRISDGARRTGYEVVAAKIVELITATNLKPGDRLPTERALSEKLGVSRTVIREAIKMLSATGTVRAQQGSGIYVSSEPHPFMATVADTVMTVEPGDVVSMFEFRTTIEMQTARLAAERITPKELRSLQEMMDSNRRCAEEGLQDPFHDSDAAFHIGIAEATRNPFLISAVTTLHRVQHWVTHIVTGRTPGSLLIAAEEHALIFSAIRDGLSEEAATAMASHIQTVKASYQQEVRRRLRGNIPHE